MGNKIRVACVGAGYFSQYQYEAWTRMPDVDLVAVCNRTEANGRKTAEEYNIPMVFTDFAAMLDEAAPDLVDIITPPLTHLDYIRIAAEKRIPMICQKPFCQTLDEAKDAVSIAKAAETLLVVHENFRFQPWHGEAKRLLKDGTLGNPYEVTFRLRPGDGQGANAYLDRQPYFQSMERFLVHETAIHLIDTFRFLMGDVTDIYARLRRLNPVIAGEDAGIILFEFADGTYGVFDGNRLADHAASNRRLTMGEMLIEGSEATLRLDGDGRLFIRRHGSNDESEHHYEWSSRGFGGDCVYLLQRHVVDCLTTGEPAMNTGADYLTNLRIENAVYESSVSGRRVSF
jgi:predicted dehydrogenase